MPAKFAQNVEYCFPCKYWMHHLVRSGNPSQWEYRCCHPLSLEDHYNPGGDYQVGKLIPDDHRPDWCPIRGDAQAEKEAESDE